MNNAVLVGSVLASVGLVGAGAAIGSTLLVLGGVVGVPVLLVGAAAIHYLNASQRAGGLGQAQERHFSAKCKDWSHRLDKAMALAKRAGVPSADLEFLVERGKATFAPHAILGVDENGASLSKTSALPRGPWIHRTDAALDILLEEAGEVAAAALNERLRDLGNRMPPEIPRFGSLPRGDLTTVCQAYLTEFEKSAIHVRGLMQGVEKDIADAEAEGHDVADAWSSFRTAKKLWDEAQPVLALRSLDEARKHVTDKVGPEFETRRLQLASALRQVGSIDLKGVATGTVNLGLERLVRDVDAVTLERGGYASLEKSERRLAEVLQELMEESLNKARRARDTIIESRALGEIEDLDGKIQILETAPKVTHPYQESFPGWVEAARQALPAIQYYTDRAALAKALPSLFKVIEAKLKTNGAVTAADVPVRDREKGAEILGFYAQQHPKSVVIDEMGNLIKLKKTGGDVPA
ncbi:MAG: hypothetical protein HY556_04880 [Euryarchaeota archaeon]|nr:hypothetical protein [Euryarchaeota archaeon]